MNIGVVDRKPGFYPISIGTSMALEGLFCTGERADNKPQVKPSKYGLMLINLRTLARNALGSFEQNKDIVKIDVLAETIELDIDGYIEAVKAVSPKTVCVVYCCQYKTINQKYPKANFRSPSTEKQKLHNALETGAIEEVIKRRKDSIELYDCDLPGKSEDTLILTHIPLDLLSAKKYQSMLLLESHSGVVKPRYDWWTKLNGATQYIPFNKAMLQIFGDKPMFASQDMKVRKVLKAIGEKKRWKYNTNNEMVLLCLRDEPFAAEFYRRYR